MAVIFSDHSKLKLEQRNLTKQKVLDTLESPEFVELTHGGRKAAYRKFGKLYLKVIFKQKGRDTIVISQYWNKDFKP
jgi:hypothetical protein